MKLLNPFEISLSGINLVEASAGTGKTYNITSLYIRALIERDIAVGKILVVTYTEAATKELKDRLLGRIRQSVRVLKSGEVRDRSDQFLRELLAEVSDYEGAADKLERAVRMFDEASIYTIHGFCYQALQEQAFESRALYDAEMVGDDAELVQEAVDDYWRNWVREVSEHPEKRLLLKLLIDSGLGPESLAKELGSYIGKPQLKVLPEDIDRDKDNDQIGREVTLCWDLYRELREIWSVEREALFTLLDSGDLSYYTSHKVTKWFDLMDDFLASEVPPLNTFTQFYRFRQSSINESLKKKAVERGITPPQHPFFQLVDAYREVIETVSRFQVWFRKDLLHYLRRELSQKKEELQVLSYDDLLLRLRNALGDPERGERLADKLREKYPLAMVDEFQDTDPNQYDIFRRIYRKSGDSALFMIGDPKQSIYSFRGADVYSYLKARGDAPGENRYRLNRNFRSVPGLLRGFNVLWGQQERPFVVEDIAYQQVRWGRDEDEYERLLEEGRERSPVRFRRLSGSGGRLRKGDARENAVDDTVREIRRLLRGGRRGEITIGNTPVRARDIAVLVRKHAQAELISDALREEGIKSVRHSDQSVFESDESEQLEQLLKAVVEPANETLVKTALSLPLTGYRAADLLAIEENEERWIQVLSQFSGWHRTWQEQGFAAMFQSLLDELEVAEHLIRYPDGERRLTNIRHLGELLQKESREGARSLLHWLARKRRENGSSTRDEEQVRLESDEELLKIVTMHKSKGLQYPIVFCPFLWYGPDIRDKGQPLEYHHPNDRETSYLDLNGKSDPERAEKRFYVRREELAENMRLAYVAMTRAEHCLYLTWAFANASEFSSLGYLLRDPEQVESLLKAKVSSGEKGDGVDDDEVGRAIGKLCEEYPDLFTLQKKPGTSGAGGEQLELLATGDPSPVFRARSFGRTDSLASRYRVSSFSSLSSWMDDDPDVPDYDQFLDGDAGETEAPAGGALTMFSFPKGPQPGTCLHHIFEEVNFVTLDQAGTAIENSLALHGIDQQWKSVALQMLETVVQKPLLPADGGLKLSALAPSDLIPEMEFYYDHEHIETREMLAIIRKEHDGRPPARGAAAPGFMKGFIDLTFQYEGKFYILDYKSNYLGDTCSDYDQASMQHEMREAFYDLQYHIYIIALHRFLAEKLSDYSYDTHVGGAFYLFLRGMNEKGREGIFHDRPPARTIRKLNRYISGGDS
ncbi:DNA helicase/exodeoxyribonuclease V, beta subunit [Fodinibius roseus]|uniref:DNA 3'-5' helicase n=1 Tax=Fodinibius roseus TaxID=1194090 RepID=A0A1M4SK51_9BACT|nr:exodeoxyribonuclease V subunit beta [Fodinibius roseus]SHE32580.1 DNA helicase/exodeoxyribonuclease V, beta subunit [Fodinibius roseus]